VEDIPIVSQPDWNDQLFKVGIRARALGLKTWSSFVKGARCFYVAERGGALVLSEWPREGRSFSAKASWEKAFPIGNFEAVADYLIDNIPPIEKVRRKPQRSIVRTKPKRNSH
jgi:hypothetical protein